MQQQDLTGGVSQQPTVMPWLKHGPTPAGPPAPPSSPLDDPQFLAAAEQGRSMAATGLVPGYREPLGALDAAKEYASSPGKLVPFYASYKGMRETKDVLDVLQRQERGEDVTEEDFAKVRDYVKLANAPKGFGYKVVDLVGQSLPFAGEFLAGGIVAKGLKTAGRAALGSAMRTALDAAAQRSAARTVGAWGMRFSPEVATARLGAWATRNAVRTGLQFPRVLENAYRKSLPPMGLSEDEATIFLDGTVDDFRQHLPEAIGQQLIENLSEETGGLLAGVNPTTVTRALQMSTLNAWLVKRGEKLAGTGVGKVLNKVLPEIGWNGILGEVFEERAGDAMRSVAGYQPWSDVIDNAKANILVELAGFGLTAGAIKLGEGLTYSSAVGLGPHISASHTVSAKETRKYADPSVLDGDGRKAISDLVAQHNEVAGSAVDEKGQPKPGPTLTEQDIKVVEPQTPYEKLIVGVAKRLGKGGAHLVEGPVPLGAEGLATQGGTILIDINNPSMSLAGVLMHEITHRSEKLAPGFHDQLVNFLKTSHPRVWHQLRGESAVAYPTLDVAGVDKETTARIVQEMPGLVMMWLTDPASAADFVDKAPGLFGTIAHAAVEVFNRAFGTEFKNIVRETRAIKSRYLSTSGLDAQIPLEDAVNISRHFARLFNSLEVLDQTDGKMPDFSSASLPNKGWVVSEYGVAPVQPEAVNAATASAEQVAPAAASQTDAAGDLPQQASQAPKGDGWTPVAPGEAIPAGSEVHVNLATGETYYRPIVREQGTEKPAVGGSTPDEGAGSDQPGPADAESAPAAAKPAAEAKPERTPEQERVSKLSDAELIAEPETPDTVAEMDRRTRDAAKPYDGVAQAARRWPMFSNREFPNVSAQWEDDLLTRLTPKSEENPRGFGPTDAKTMLSWLGLTEKPGARPGRGIYRVTANKYAQPHTDAMYFSGLHFWLQEIAANEPKRKITADEIERFLAANRFQFGLVPLRSNEAWGATSIPNKSEARWMPPLFIGNEGERERVAQRFLDSYREMLLTVPQAAVTRVIRELGIPALGIQRGWEPPPAASDEVFAAGDEYVAQNIRLSEMANGLIRRLAGRPEPEPFDLYLPYWPQPSAIVGNKPVLNAMLQEADTLTKLAELGVRPEDFRADPLGSLGYGVTRDADASYDARRVGLGGVADEVTSNREVAAIWSRDQLAQRAHNTWGRRAAMVNAGLYGLGTRLRPDMYFAPHYSYATWNSGTTANNPYARSIRNVAASLRVALTQDTEGRVVLHAVEIQSDAARAMDDVFTANTAEWKRLERLVAAAKDPSHPDHEEGLRSRESAEAEMSKLKERGAGPSDIDYFGPAERHSTHIPGKTWVPLLPAFGDKKMWTAQVAKLLATMMVESNADGILVSTAESVAQLWSNPTTQDNGPFGLYPVLDVENSRGSRTIRIRVHPEDSYSTTVDVPDRALTSVEAFGKFLADSNEFRRATKTKAMRDADTGEVTRTTALAWPPELTQRLYDGLKNAPVNGNPVPVTGPFPLGGSDYRLIYSKALEYLRDMLAPFGATIVDRTRVANDPGVGGYQKALSVFFGRRADKFDAGRMEAPGTFGAHGVYLEAPARERLAQFMREDGFPQFGSPKPNLPPAQAARRALRPDEWDLTKSRTPLGNISRLERILVEARLEDEFFPKELIEYLKGNKDVNKEELSASNLLGWLSALPQDKKVLRLDVMAEWARRRPVVHVAQVVSPKFSNTNWRSAPATGRMQDYKEFVFGFTVELARRMAGREQVKGTPTQIPGLLRDLRAVVDEAKATERKLKITTATRHGSTTLDPDNIFSTTLPTFNGMFARDGLLYMGFHGLFVGTHPTDVEWGLANNASLHAIDIPGARPGRDKTPLRVFLQHGTYGIPVNSLDDVVKFFAKHAVLLHAARVRTALDVANREIPPILKRIDDIVAQLTPGTPLANELSLLGAVDHTLRVELGSWRRAFDEALADAEEVGSGGRIKAALKRVSDPDRIRGMSFALATNVGSVRMGGTNVDFRTAVDSFLANAANPEAVEAAIAEARRLAAEADETERALDSARAVRDASAGRVTTVHGPKFGVDPTDVDRGMALRLEAITGSEVAVIPSAYSWQNDMFLTSNRAARAYGAGQLVAMLNSRDAMNGVHFRVPADVGAGRVPSNISYILRELGDLATGIGSTHKFDELRAALASRRANLLAGQTSISVVSSLSSSSRVVDPIRRETEDEVAITLTPDNETPVHVAVAESYQRYADVIKRARDRGDYGDDTSYTYTQSETMEEVARDRAARLMRESVEKEYVTKGTQTMQGAVEASQAGYTNKVIPSSSAVFASNQGLVHGWYPSYTIADLYRALENATDPDVIETLVDAAEAHQQVRARQDAIEREVDLAVDAHDAAVAAVRAEVAKFVDPIGGEVYSSANHIGLQDEFSRYVPVDSKAYKLGQALTAEAEDPTLSRKVDTATHALDYQARLLGDSTMTLVGQVDQSRVGLGMGDYYSGGHFGWADRSPGASPADVDDPTAAWHSRMTTRFLREPDGGMYPVQFLDEAQSDYFFNSISDWPAENQDEFMRRLFSSPAPVLQPDNGSAAEVLGRLKLAISRDNAALANNLPDTLPDDPAAAAKAINTALGAPVGLGTEVPIYPLEDRWMGIAAEHLIDMTMKDPTKHRLGWAPASGLVGIWPDGRDGQTKGGLVNVIEVKANPAGGPIRGSSSTMARVSGLFRGPQFVVQGRVSRAQTGASGNILGFDSVTGNVRHHLADAAGNVDASSTMERSFDALTATYGRATLAASSADMRRNVLSNQFLRPFAEPGTTLAVSARFSDLSRESVILYVSQRMPEMVPTDPGSVLVAVARENAARAAVGAAPLDANQIISNRIARRQPQVWEPKSQTKVGGPDANAAGNDLTDTPKDIPPLPEPVTVGLTGGNAVDALHEALKSLGITERESAAVLRSRLLEASGIVGRHGDVEASIPSVGRVLFAPEGFMLGAAKYRLIYDEAIPRQVLKRLKTAGLVEGTDFTYERRLLIDDTGLIGDAGLGDRKHMGPAHIVSFTEEGRDKYLKHRASDKTWSDFAMRREELPRSIRDFITEGEARSLNKRTLMQLLGMVSPLARQADDIGVLARIGHEGRFWYHLAHRVFSAMGYDDRWRVPLVYAAMSPQKSVTQNARLGATVYRRWNDAGRPTDMVALQTLFPRGQYPFTLDNDYPNTLAVLSSQTREEALAKMGKGNKSPKVTSFAHNLTGEFEPTTNDTWMGQALGITRDLEGITYRAVSVALRKATAKLNAMPGVTVPWTPAEVQAAAWATARWIGESMVGPLRASKSFDEAWPGIDRGPAEGAMWPGDDLATLTLFHPEVSGELERAGVDLAAARAAYDEGVEWVREQSQRAGDQGGWAGVPEGTRRRVGRRIWGARTARLAQKRQAAEGLTGPPASQAAIRVEALKDRFVDAFGPVRRMVYESAASTDDLDPWLRERLRRGRTRARLDTAWDSYMEPIRKQAAAHGLWLDGNPGGLPSINEYLMALHAPERNATIAKRDPGNNAGSGMDDVEAARIVAAAHASPAAGGYRAIAALVQAMNRATRANWVKYGLETQETVDGLEAAWKNYVPLRTQVEDDPSGIGMGDDIRGGEFRSALGRGSRADHPLAFSWVQHQASIVRGEKNLVGNTMLGLAQHIGNPDVVAIDVPQTKWVLNKRTGLKQRAFDPHYRTREEVFATRVAGRTVFLTFGKGYEGVALALKGTNVEYGGPITEAMGKLMRFFGGLSTRYNPVFSIFNAIRDLSSSMLTLTGEQGAAFAGSVLATYPAAMDALRRRSFGTPTGTGLDKLLKEYEEDGAPVSWLDLRGVDDAVRDVDNVYASMPRNKSGRAISAVGKAILNWIDKANEAVEQSVRFATYVNARKPVAQGGLGLTRERAALMAKELTTNFEQKGEWGNLINAWYMFFNANVQGTARVARALKQPGVQRLMVGVVLASAAMEVMNRAIGGDDDDGEKHYDKIPAHERGTFLTLMSPNGGKRVRIPLPFVYNVFFSAGTAIGSLFDGRNSAGTAALEVGTTLVNASNPLGNGNDLLETALPTIADPFYQHAINKNWAGYPIMPTNMPWGLQKPDSELYWPSVNPLAQSITSWLNEVTGGDTVRAGWVSVSPETVEHVTSALVGGVGTEMGRVIDLAEKAALGRDISHKDIPIVRRLYAESDPYHVVKRFRDNLLKVEELEARVEALRSQRKGDEATRLIRDNQPLWALRERAKNAKKLATTWRNLRNKGVLPEVQDTRSQAMMREFNRAFIERVGYPGGLP